MKQYLTCKEKKNIVDEAYSRENNIKATARMHNISPAQIRRWNEKLPDTLNKNGIMDRRKCHIMNLKMVQGDKLQKDADKYDELKSYYENIQNMDSVVTVGMLCFELKQLKLAMDIDMQVLCKRIYWWLSSEHIVQR